MLNLPKMTYLLLLVLIIVLAGCQMPRSSGSDLSTAPPPTPTLAPLGADTAGEIPAEATPIPTIINVQPTATPSLMGEGQEATEDNQLVSPTPSAPEMEIEPVATNTQNGPETFVPPAAESSEQPVIVSAPAPELPDGGPVAANPPAGQPSSYSVPAADNATAYNGSTYLVQSGDTLFAISMRYGVTVQDFMYANNLTSDYIYAGQTLIIPDGSTYAPAPGYDQAPVSPGYNTGYHVVSPGETLFSIAQEYGTSVEALAAANGLVYPYIIYEGQTLSISGPDMGYYPQQDVPAYPAPSDNYYQQPVYPPSDLAGTHTVVPGETLFSIAQRYGTSAQAIAQANGLSNPNQIYVGQVLYLP